MSCFFFQVLYQKVRLSPNVVELWEDDFYFLGFDELVKAAVLPFYLCVVCLLAPCLTPKESNHKILPPEAAEPVASDKSPDDTVPKK